jgi:osmoprotectant transport system ATP-binding protein
MLEMSKAVKIKFDSVSKVYPNNTIAVDDLSLEIYEHELFVLVGPSGCGKTTTLKMINRLIDPTKGKIYIDGQDISCVNPIELRLNIGYAIQDVGLFPHMTAEENIAVVPKLKKWPKDVIEKRVVELFNMNGLPPDVFRKRYPNELSGGQRQRVGVARALAADPPIVLMDEPFGALDPLTRVTLQDEFLRIKRIVKKTIVFVTHDIEEAVKLGDRLGIMKNGKLIQVGTPREILKNPRDDFVKSIIGADKVYKRIDVLKVEDFLIKDVPTVNLRCSLKEAEDFMSKSNTEAVVVVDDEKRPVGVVSLKDIYKSRDEASRVESVLKPMDLQIGMDECALEAFKKMASLNVSLAPVVDNQCRLKGVITFNNVVNVLLSH